MLAKSKWPEVESKLLLVAAWCRDGLTDKQIADKLHISERTFYEYKDKHPQFSQSLKENKEYVDTQVENALLKRALGYSYKETTTELEEGPLGVKKKVRTIKKEVIPDVTAQAIWLQNRKAKEWRKNLTAYVPDNDNEDDDNVFAAITEAVKK